MDRKPSIQSDTQAKDGDAPPTDERRAHGRVGFTTRVWVHELDDSNAPGEGHVADAADISRSGMGFRSRRMYYIGRTIVIILTLSTERKPMFGIVRSSRYTYGGQHHVGVEFCAKPPGDRLHAWIEARMRSK